MDSLVWNQMTVFDAFLYVKKTIISQFFLGSRPLWLLSKLLQVQPPVSRADFASVEAYIKHLELQIEYGRMKALIKSMENNDKGDNVGRQSDEETVADVPGLIPAGEDGREEDTRQQ